MTLASAARLALAPLLAQCLPYTRPGTALTAALALAAGLAGCSPSSPPSPTSSPAPLGHDAYVWQRHWQAPVRAALRDSADLVGAWRILAGEVDAQGRLRRVEVDLAAIAASGRPATPVIRIDGGAGLDAARLGGEIASLRQTWTAASVPVVGIEIDHDSSTRQLAAYAGFLAALRPSLATGQRLSITLLPDWLDDPDFDRLLAATDEVVLQLHSLHNPSRQLFDAASARAWTAALARRTGKPFQLALPDYGSRVVRNPHGRIEAVESETPIGLEADTGEEMFASPTDIAAFLRRLEKDRPRGLAGIVWFRLPVAGDQRAWKAATWRRVITGQMQPAQLTAGVEAPTAAGLRPLVLSNIGEVDGELPPAVVAAAPCRGIAAHPGYALEPRDGDAVFVRTRKGLFQAGSRVVVGSVRCPEGEASVHVEN